MTPAQQKALQNAVAGLMPWAEELFSAVRAASLDEVGVTRPAWSEQDQAAAEILMRAAKDQGLSVRMDPIGNTYATLTGQDPSAPAVLSGSHLDSVAKGGNYDGLAGAVAGLVAVSAIRQAGLMPMCSLTAMGIRGEESVWYGIAYIGARLAAGAMDHDEFDQLIRLDSGLTLAVHMQALGLAPGDIWSTDAPEIRRENVKAFLELHIEQGPLLVEEATPLAAATAIRGNLRYGDAVCYGAYQHSAATPRRSRKDAVLAVTELLQRLEGLWHESEDNDDSSAVFTVGKLFTDPNHHALTKVPGECHFSLNFGSTDQTTLDRAADAIAEMTAEIAQQRRVEFVLGEPVGSSPTPLDPELRQRLAAQAARLKIPCLEFATVGHDASIFAKAGIPSTVLLVRNGEGSHNPHEQMDMNDFAHGVQVLAATMADLSGV